jgi:hypothetical protein
VEDSRIFVQFREGRKIKEDVMECLDYIKEAGIHGPRMGGIHDDYGIIRDIPYEDRDRVLKILKDKDLPVVAEWLEPRQHKTH